MEEQLKKLAQALIEGRVDTVAEMTTQSIDQKVSAEQILNSGLLAGMDVVGQRFKAGQMYIPEVLRSAKAMRAAMEHLRPLLAEAKVETAGTMVIGTVEGDLHDIGKNLVAMMFEGAGFQVVNIGVDQKPQAFVEAAQEHKPELLCMSALLTTTMPKMGATIGALKEAGLRDKVKIMIGGAPVTSDFAAQIGADAYGANAAMAVDKGRELLRA